ncbi:MAG TPA: Mur ligase family protein, partial [Anaerolineales bacterium]|nr:Mur ligase family protein [Anaerolineales bacterium]
MENEKKYQETLDYLYGFVDYSLTHGSQLAAAHFDLKRMRDFMEELGNPQLTYPVIHIAGTKGKGSVASLCANSLHAQGYRVGLYTSPHLYDYAERIQVNGQEITHDELIELVDELRPYLDRGTELTTFEITTAMALLYFARQKVSVVVLEVGLGGRLDATNIITPLVSVITSISLDHTNVLGNTLQAIAGEKAGIIKKGVPLIVAPQKFEAFQVIERIAIQQSAPMVVVGKDFQYRLNSSSLEGQDMSVWNTSRG